MGLPTTDITLFQEDIDSFPTNQALLLLVTENKTEENNTKALQNGDDCKNDEVPNARLYFSDQLYFLSFNILSCHKISLPGSGTPG